MKGLLVQLASTGKNSSYFDDFDNQFTERQFFAEWGQVDQQTFPEFPPSNGLSVLKINPYPITPKACISSKPNQQKIPWITPR